MYAAGVRQMNDWLASVFAALDARRLFDRTSLVLTSDHGEELLDDGHVGHASTAHHAQLHDQVLRIPLLVIDLRVTAPRRVATRVQGLDLFPTLHALAGVPVPAAEGVDLSPTIFGAGEPAVAPDRLFHFHSARMGCPTPREYADHQIEGISDGRWKYLAERYDAPRELLYDLAADPAEQHPVDDPDRLAAWRARMPRQS